MTEQTVWDKLAEPFSADKVKQRPGAATYQHKPDCQGARCPLTRDAGAHIQFDYVDARDVAQRLDEVLTPGGWDFMAESIGEGVVHGHLVLYVDRTIVREDFGYPNSDRDEEPIKAATSDALKRCAVLVGVGRHLYGDNKPSRPVRSAPQRPQNAPQATQPAQAQQSTSGLPGLSMSEFFAKAEAAGVDKKRISDVAKDLFGQWSVKALAPEQRVHLLEELTTSRPSAGSDGRAAPVVAPATGAEPELDWGVVS